MPPHLHALREGAGEVTPFRIDMVAACERTGKKGTRVRKERPSSEEREGRWTETPDTQREGGRVEV
ncbi:hypothetical protein E2C01_088404 [Portunus trituberculatus]|uniref:Uncharacterized protein n=1 Tax=Portunus trituberculatus TaxID=210409 RepID=A0A5B7J636_PORTR|nr:hypothetical protein [Portunus trituberculatus]